MNKYIDLYKNELKGLVMPFWLKHSVDQENGGFFTCLDRMGRIYDTDKFVWLQARQVWTFSMLHNKNFVGEKYLNQAISCADFLIENAIDNDGNWYFSLNQQGQPLVAPYNIFSDCFGALAMGELYKATHNEVYKTIALNSFENILRRKDNPKGKYNKCISENRPLIDFSLPMILCNLCMELEDLLSKDKTSILIDELTDMIFTKFLDPHKGIIHEYVNKDGTFSDTFDGRLINPGHGIEAMWFILDIAKQKNNTPLMKKAISVVYNTLEFAWDKEYNGLYYFMDIKGHPLKQLEWSQKLWWVHLETLVCLAKIYEYTEDDHAWAWFKKVHEYTWTHFKDKEFAEWYGYLDRQGEPLMSLKGGKWKGCFHVPRGLYNVMTSLKNLELKRIKK